MERYGNASGPLSKEEKLNLLSRIANDTLNETLERLDRRNSLLIVRPTGFGKSYLLANLTSSKNEDGSNRFKKCLYIYPTKVIKVSMIEDYGPTGHDERANTLQNTTFISYSLLTTMINTVFPDEDSEKEGKAYTFHGKELFKGIIDISSDTDWRADEIKKEYPVKNRDYVINNKLSLRKWIKSFDLIMMDECHKACSKGFLKTWNYIGTIINNSAGAIKKEKGETPVKLIGVTATPYRLDGLDINEIFGKKNRLSELTLSDCIKLGIMNRFDYVYAIGDREEFYKSSLKLLNDYRKEETGHKINKYESQELIDTINKMKSLPEIIKKSIKPENINSSGYMRFIIFFDNKSHIKRDGETVINWFKEAYPEKEVHHKVIATATKNDDYDIVDVDELAKLDDFIRKNPDTIGNRIDLILCVDKLNMGYHVENITGIMILRETKSAVVYNQQIGRCFSVRAETKPIIFDIVDKAKPEDILSNSTGKGNGVKVELPDIIDAECADTKNYAGDYLLAIRSIHKQKCSSKKRIVRFLSESRHAPVDVISAMTELSVDEVEKILNKR